MPFELHGRIAVILLDAPPVNSLSQGLRTTLTTSLNAAIESPNVDAIVVAGAGKMFCGGADLAEFNQPVRAEPSLRTILAIMEASAKPIVAAIHGFALGGGFELALGCHYRVATPDTKLALPEITLGLLPGGGGTQRLPRLIGVEAALEIILSGKRLNARQAQAKGLINAVVEGDLVPAALEWLRARGTDITPTPLSARPTTLGTDMPIADFFEQTRKSLSQKKGSQRAAMDCVSCVEAATSLPFEEGLDHERKLFLALVQSTESKSLRHLFFSERNAAKIPGLDPDTAVQAIHKIGVIGAGFMGSGIAMCCINAGIPTQLLDQNAEALQRGLDRIHQTYARMVEKGTLTQVQMDDRIALLHPSTEYKNVGDVDLAIEAIYEDMDAKKKVFAELDKACRPDAILATNTSRLNIDELASVTSRPERVLGMHFFSPANIMRLLEIVRAPLTSDTTLATAMSIGKKIGKLPIAVGMCDGFVGNRMVAVYLREAGFLLEDGAEPGQVDKALTDFGMAMGPFAMMDMVGLDISWAARKRLAATRPKDQRYSKLADMLCEAGRFGQKTGAGYFRYEGTSRKPLPDPQVTALIQQCATEAGVVRRDIPDEEIVARTIHALIDEGTKILEEGIAARASDIDLIYVHGYGFPAWRGGPMFYAETSATV